MNKLIEKMLLETIQKNASVVSMFKTGYSYAEIMQCCEKLEEEGKIEWDEDGAKCLTKIGKVRLKELKKEYPKEGDYTIRPLSQYKMVALDIEDIYLP